MAKQTLTEVFVEGARKGWDIGAKSIAPNLVMAFTVIYILKLLGVLDLIGRLLGPIMQIFGLPGEAVTVLFAAWMSMAAGIGVMSSLAAAGILNGNHVTILLAANFLMGAQLQYMGRILGTMEVKSSLFPVLFAICIINALCSMMAVNLILRFLG
jgi:Uncharacterized membrane protein